LLRLKTLPFDGLAALEFGWSCAARAEGEMNTKDFLRLGAPLGEATRRATDFVAKFILSGGDKSRLHEEVAALVANPSAFVDDPLRGEDGT
jgi:hypothetical protein